LDPHVKTLPQVLRDAGYATELVGKWHLGRSGPELRPLQRGFDGFLGLLGGWIDYQSHAGGAGADWWRGEDALVQVGHSTRLLADEAVRVIAERDPAKPLYLQVAFNAPHAPTSVPPGRSIDEMPGADPARRAYALLVDELDRAVGRVLDALEEEGLGEDTLVVFASDNGAPTAYGGSNGALRGEKGTVFGGGLRVPAIVSWRGQLTRGRSELMVNAVDFAPTLCRAAGVAWSTDAEQDGVDMWDALRGAAQPIPRTAIFGVERADGVSFAAFDGRWKLVRLAGSGAPLLFDVRADPSETRDLAAQEPAIVARLAAELEPWRARPHTPFVPDEEPQRGISGDASK
jgi:arylsulfatase A-like enzyme